MLIEVHMIKNYALSNLNRDDTEAQELIFGVSPGPISASA